MGDSGKAGYPESTTAISPMIVEEPDINRFLLRCQSVIGQIACIHYIKLGMNIDPSYGSGHSLDVVFSLPVRLRREAIDEEPSRNIRAGVRSEVMQIAYNLALAAWNMAGLALSLENHFYRQYHTLLRRGIMIRLVVF